MVRIRVKTKSGEFNDWQWVCKKDGSIFRHVQLTGDFTVLVNLTAETKDMDYFVIPTPILNRWLIEDHNLWLASPGKRGKPHSTANTKRHLNFPSSMTKLAIYKNNWDILWE
jgi:hypothetical protein